MKSGRESNQRKGRRPGYLDHNLQVVFGITLMAVPWVSIITPAFPIMVEELNIS
jgi:hypothetical protein